MKTQDPWYIPALSYIVIPSDSKNRVYQTTSEPWPWYDYVNYYLLPNTQSSYQDLTITLDGNSVSPLPGINLHVSDMKTNNQNEIKQFWLQSDSVNVGFQVSVNGVQLFRLSSTRTYVDYANTPLGTSGFGMRPLYAYGTTNIPTLTIHNFSPSYPALALLPGQGIQVWGYTLYTKEITNQAQISKIIDSGRYTTVSVLPPQVTTGA